MYSSPSISGAHAYNAPRVCTLVPFITRGNREVCTSLFALPCFILNVNNTHKCMYMYVYMF